MNELETAEHALGQLDGHLADVVSDNPTVDMSHLSTWARLLREAVDGLAGIVKAIRPVDAPVIPPDPSDHLHNDGAKSPPLTEEQMAKSLLAEHLRDK